MMNEHSIEEKSDKQCFINEINRRGITKLLHFTTNKNVISIFREGLIMPRNMLESSNNVHLLNCDYQDNHRLDGKDHINCSIERINSKMFNKILRDISPEERDVTFFCVLAISPKYIYRKTTMFSVTNAANSYNRNFIKIDGSFKKFISMFDNEIAYQTSDSVRHITRTGTSKDCIPTDVQAEVLVYDTIPVNDIIHIYVQKEINMHMLASVMDITGIENKHDIQVKPEIFYS